ELAAYIAAIEFHSPQIPVISNTTRMPYPSDPDEIKKILMAHLESTVHWMDNVKTLWDTCGTRVFVEVGPGEVLSNLIADTLPGSTCIRTCVRASEGATFKAALTRLSDRGYLMEEEIPKDGFSPAFGKAAKSSEVVPGSADPPESDVLMERLIQIIMDATGFNRDEIQPDMDLRSDLSIRSSRLPIIMDAAERQFKITIELEDFIDVRTVKDIANGISRLTAGQKDNGPHQAVEALEQNPMQDKCLTSSKDEASLNRLVFGHATIASQTSSEAKTSVPMELHPGDAVVFLSPDGDDKIAGQAGDILNKDYKVTPFPMGFLQESIDPGKPGHDIRTQDGALR
ncbi:MAG: phosphopantetheine-binding protein, partial [Desulfobacteraceae bacterium]|nr:phosphopantetheine-binding protein [Desulfobacteraceae bacterium]